MYRSLTLTSRSVHCAVQTQSLTTEEINISRHSVFPCQCHGTIAPFSSPTTYFYFQNEGRIWQPSKKHCSFGNREAWNRKVLPLIYLFFWSSKSMPCVRRLVNGLSPRTARSVHWFETHKVTLGQVYSEYFCFFPYPHHSTNIQYSSSPTRCSYQKDKRAKPGIFPGSKVLSEVGENWTRCFQSLAGL